MKENDLRLFFSKTNNKFSEIGQIFERELIAVTEHGDALKCEISPTAVQMFDHEAGLFSGKLEIIVNFAKFEVLEDPQPSLFSTEAEYTEVKTEEQIQQEIIEENEAEQEREKEIEKKEEVMKWGLEENFTADALENIKLHNINLPDATIFGGSAFIQGLETLKTEGFIIGYKGEPQNPLKMSIIPLMVPNIDEAYPIVFLKKKAAEFVFKAIKTHPKFINRIKNFDVYSTSEVDFEGVYILLVADGLKFLRAMSRGKNADG